MDDQHEHNVGEYERHDQHMHDRLLMLQSQNIALENQISNNRAEINFGMKDIITILTITGALISAWVTLNNSQVETDTKLEAFEKYYRDSLIESKKLSQDRDNELKMLILEQKRSNKELIDQVNSLERSVSMMYSNRIK